MREPIRVFLDAPAGQNHASNDRNDRFVLGKPIDLGRSVYVALQIKWWNLVGFDAITKHINGYVSLTGGTDEWDKKTRVDFNFNAASGFIIIPLIGVVCEQFLKLDYRPAAITEGFIDIHVYGK